MNDTRETADLTIVQCTSDDASMQLLFAQVACLVASRLAEQPKEIYATIADLVDLFRAVDDPPKKSVQGLWGELLLIANSRDPLLMTRAWHGTPGDKFDFALGTERVEVKTATSGSRKHHFRLDQLVSPNVSICVVSLFVEASGAGTTVRDLVNELHGLLLEDIQAQLKVEKTVASTLGRDWKHAELQKFDRVLAESSLTLLDAMTIPRVQGEIPDGVSEVAFVADAALGSALPIAGRGTLWSALP